MSERESRYEINPAERVRVLYPDVITETDSFTYSFDQGYERLTVRHEQGGALEFRGSYHPDVVCEGGGVCKWCGCTLGDFAP